MPFLQKVYAMNRLFFRIFEKINFMKKILLTISIALYIITMHAQRKIDVDETSYSFKTGKQFALKTVVFEADPKFVSNEWEDLMKNFKGKVSGNKEEVFADNIMAKEFNDNNPCDVYAHFVQNSEGNTIVYVAVDLGGAYMNASDHSSKVSDLKKILYNFAKTSSENKVKDMIKDASKVLSTLESDQKKLVTENENLHKDIEKYKEKIVKAEDDIKTNLSNQETKKKEVEEQVKVVEGLNTKLKGIN